MSKRAEDVAETRSRIIEAAAHLHGTIGPAATTISAIAEQAGVTRLTVYRHFPDDQALFAACSAHWAAGQILPNPASWTTIADPEKRLLSGLSDLYRFYRDGEPMLTRVRRDQAALPVDLQKRTAATETRYRDALLQPFSVRGAHRTRLRGVLGHTVSFWTWRSLCLEQGLSNKAAVGAMTALALATAGYPDRPGQRP